MYFIFLSALSGAIIAVIQRILGINVTSSVLPNEVAGSVFIFLCFISGVIVEYYGTKKKYNFF